MPSPEAQDNELVGCFSGPLPEIRTMGLMQFDPVWAVREHVSPVCELLHVVAGAVDLVTPSGRFPAQAGDTLLVPSNTLHRDEFELGTDLSILFISFTWPCEEAYFRRVRPDATLAISSQRRVEIAGLFDQLRGDVAGPTAVDELVARARVLTVLLLFLRDALAAQTTNDAADGASPADRRHQALVAGAKAYLQKHLANAVTLDEIASHLGVSSYHLSHVFSRETSFSLYTFLTATRMDKAKALLREGRLNVSEVAYAVGYHDPSYFSRAFKDRCGCSPSVFATQSHDR